MARGKHAAMAARRRYETTLVLAERLADKNAELKTRARKVEADAAHLPAAMKRIAELEKQLDEGVTPALRKERDEREAERVELELAAADLKRVIRELYSAAELAIESVRGDQEHPRWIPGWILEQRARLGIVMVGTRDSARRFRRAQEQNRTSADLGEHKMQDNRRTQRENDARTGAVLP